MPIKMERSAVAGKVPTIAQLDLGELAVNTRDGKIYLKTDDGAGGVAVQEFRNWADLSSALAGKSDTGHGHVIGDVTGLQTALDGKSATSHNHAGVYEPVDADILRADTADQLAAGFTVTLDDDGSVASGTYTPAPDAGTAKEVTVTGAITFAPPSPAVGEVIFLSIFLVIGSGAGTITTSGWTTVKGDAFTTTLNDKFLCSGYIQNNGGTIHSRLMVEAQQ